MQLRPIVPQPNTIAFSPTLGLLRLAARQPTVKGSIRQATLSVMLSGTSYNE